VALTPEKASYRQALMARLLMLEVFLQEQARREGRPMPGPAR
jgi:cytochrome c-type biogenesis protein CcmH